MKNGDRYYRIELAGGRTVDLPSVTSILSVIDARGLTEWRVDKGREESKAISSEARDIGDEGHSLVRRISNGGSIARPEWESLDGRVCNGVRAWVRWRDQVGFIPKHTEMVVYSLKYGYAGTLDTVGTISPKVPILADYKFARALYHETNDAQVVAYDTAYAEMFPKRKPRELYFVRLDKETGIPEPYKIENRKLPWETFLAALTIFNNRIKVKLGGDNDTGN